MEQILVDENLQAIPGVGPAMARDLMDLGVHQISWLKDRDPEMLFDQLCTIRGYQVDKCVLYVFRCAIYFASTENPDPELLKWWNWKNKV